MDAPKKGRGGARPNTGGARPGAGRPRKPPEKPAEDSVLAVALTHKDPQSFLMAVMNDVGSEPKHRIEAAKALMPFMHKKLGEGGKKDAAVDQAKALTAGKFAPRGAPLRAVS